MSKESGKSGSIGFAGMLTILFIGLKLTGHIDWSWWWVVSPIWITVGAVAGIFFIAAVIIGCIELYENWGDKQ